jgi:Ca2+/Na+ antiporter
MKKTKWAYRKVMIFIAILYQLVFFLTLVYKGCLYDWWEIYLIVILFLLACTTILYYTFKQQKLRASDDSQSKQDFFVERNNDKVTVGNVIADIYNLYNPSPISKKELWNKYSIQNDDLEKLRTEISNLTENMKEKNTSIAKFEDFKKSILSLQSKAGTTYLNQVIDCLNNELLTNNNFKPIDIPKPLIAILDRLTESDVEKLEEFLSNEEQQSFLKDIANNYNMYNQIQSRNEEFNKIVQSIPGKQIELSGIQDKEIHEFVVYYNKAVEKMDYLIFFWSNRISEEYVDALDGYSLAEQFKRLYTYFFMTRDYLRIFNHDYDIENQSKNFQMIQNEKAFTDLSVSSIKDGATYPTYLKHIALYCQDNNIKIEAFYNESIVPDNIKF